MFQTTAECRVTAAVFQELGHQEQRNAFYAVRCIGQFGQNQVQDVVGQIMLTAGDPDLGTADGIAAVRLRYGTGTDQAQVGAALWLGQAHGACPLTADQFWQVAFLQFTGAVSGQRIDRAMSQAWVHTQGQVGRTHHLFHHHVQHMR